MRRQAMAILVGIFWLSSALPSAANPGLVGLWKVDGGTLEIRDGGVFVGSRDGSGSFTGRWRIEEAAGVLVLDRDDGKNAQCHYVVNEKTLTLSNCPASGTYLRG
jgi:hypothetical protein